MTKRGTPVMHLAAAIEAWFAARKAARQLSATTERTYRHHLRRFSEHVGRDTPVNAISTGHVLGWMATMNHVQPGSLKTATAPIRSFFAWAVDEGLVDADPTKRIPQPSLPPAEYRGLEPDTIARLLHVSDFRERTIVLLGLHLGLRCCEMSRADWPDWNRSAGTLSVRGKGFGGRVSRVLPVSGEVGWVLSVWADRARTGPVFPSQHGDRLQANSISQIVTRVARRAGVAATAHQLRHACAHDMLAMGALPNAVQRFLGHTDLKTTGIYLAAKDEELRAAMCRVYTVGGGADMRSAA